MVAGGKAAHFLTAGHDPEAANECLRAGAHHYFFKPIKLDEFRHVLETTWRTYHVELENNRQRDELEPDAYATGISLYALRAAGVPATNEAYMKGITFLRKSQYQDGSWLVKTRSYPTQPYFESGYPFGNNCKSTGSILT